LVGTWSGGDSLIWRELGTASRNDWSIAGTGDFDGSGTDDILWRGSNSFDGTVGMWTDGSSRAWQQFGKVSAEWQIAVG
jgi:hypothetical protein